MTAFYTYSAERKAPQPKPKTLTSGVLPLLVILFIVSYGILTLLVFEQGRTIEAQRSLIREMLKDSTQLASLKSKLARDDSKRHDEAAALPAEHPAEHADTDAASAAPAPKAAGKDAKPSGKTARSMKVPQKPAADFLDVRRSTRVI